MNTNEVLRSISAGLTGSVDDDIRYLEQQSERYRDTEGYHEIRAACDRLIHILRSSEDLTDGSEKEPFGTMLGDIPPEFSDSEDFSGESMPDFLIEEDPDDEENLFSRLVQLVEEIESESLPVSDEDVIWFDAFDDFENALYVELFDPDSSLVQPYISFASIYLDYATCLNDLGHYEEAIEALEKAMQWNPINEMIHLEYARSFRLKGDFDRLEQIATDTFRYIYHREAMARCYNDLAFCFQHRRRFLEAFCCYKSSLLCLPSDNEARDQIAFLRHSRPDFREPSIEKVIEVLITNNIPPGPSIEVVQLACGLAFFCKEAGEREEALHFILIAFDLLPSYDIQQQMEEILLMQESADFSGFH